jgi:hypothetical protein
MRKLLLAVRFLSLVSIALLPSGCTTTSRVADNDFTREYNVSRSSFFRYKVPVGWFDASSDTKSEIWLLKNDYSASITVHEIKTDDDARRSINSTAGLTRIAQLSMALRTSDPSFLLVAPPVADEINGHSVSSYDITSTATHDTLRVIVLRTNGRVYEIVALVDGVRKGSAVQVFRLQRAFMEYLRW